MLEIDGSFRRGRRPDSQDIPQPVMPVQGTFQVSNIRKNRERPGLMPQHLTSVRACRLISSAEVQGDFVGSREVSFIPHTVRGGELFFDIGTAGSTMLVLQTLIPALAISGEKSVVTLKGGTHVPFSPSYHYVHGVFVPILERIGIKMSLSIDQYGFYPKGGGTIRAELFPAHTVKALDLGERGRVICRSASRARMYRSSW